MKLKIDRESDALYLRLDEREIVESRRSRSLESSWTLTYHGQVVGIEMLEISKRTAEQSNCE